MNAAVRGMVLLLMAMLSACARLPISPAPTTAEVGIDGGVLWYRGIFADAAVLRRLSALYAQQDPPPTRLRIDSEGGNVHLALNLGEWIQARELDVEVLGQCASSCANYVFTAGRRKLLHPDSVLLWHGGAFQASLETDALRRGEAVYQDLHAWRQRELAFFARAGIDPLITVYGQLPPWDAIYEAGRYAGYDYSLDDLLRLGVTGVETLGGAWRPDTTHGVASVLRITVDPNQLPALRVRVGLPALAKP
ncbi:MAG TPA: hypothetical protein VGE57_11265 [Solimonas sp.]